MCSVCIRSMDSEKFDMVIATICVVWFLGIIPCNSFGYQNLNCVYIFIGNVNALILPFYSPSYTINASERTHTPSMSSASIGRLAIKFLAWMRFNGIHIGLITVTLNTEVSFRSSPPYSNCFGYIMW